MPEISGSGTFSNTFDSGTIRWTTIEDAARPASHTVPWRERQARNIWEWCGEESLESLYDIAARFELYTGEEVVSAVRTIYELGLIDPGAYSEWIEDNECGCEDYDCSQCYPLGYECECADHDCDRCYPDGPPECECGDISCTDCYPDGAGHPVDDMGDDDDWAGVGEVEAPPGRTRFGIEIEFNTANRHDLIGILQRNGFATVDFGYSHDVVRCWKMTTDASVSGGELVSPIMSGSDESIEQVREAMRLMKRHGAETGRNVGLHVHMDATQFRRSQLAAMAWNLQAFEKVFAAYVPSHRYTGDGGNQYGATLIHASTWERVQEWIETVNVAERERTRQNRNSACPAGRYSSFNFNSLLTYGSVECRLLGHTLNTIKIRAWIRALQTVMAAARRRRRVPGGVDGLNWLVEQGLEPEHAEHFREVVAGRNRTEWLTTLPVAA